MAAAHSPAAADASCWSTTRAARRSATASTCRTRSAWSPTSRPHLVRRALTSLRAELRHREHMLSPSTGQGPRSSWSGAATRTSPPSLVIVVDEFAALVQEVPEFVDGVVNVAQRGRSLGLHLILATQRPAGVIKDNLRANTNLRVALRMADEADSDGRARHAAGGVLRSGHARARAVSKTGPGRLHPFQTGVRRRVDDGRGPDRPSWTWTSWRSAPARSGRPPEADDRHEVQHELGPTDIARVVATQVRRAAAQSAEMPGAAQALAARARAPSTTCQLPTRAPRRRARLRRQRRAGAARAAAPSLPAGRDGNLAVFGTGGSGKSRCCARSRSRPATPSAVRPVPGVRPRLRRPRALPCSRRCRTSAA